MACYCYPLTLRDGFSRFVLRCDGLLGPHLRGHAAAVRAAFAEYGLPDRIRSDNGGPFASTGLGAPVGWPCGGFAWASSRTDCAGHPEQNGSHEQFHPVLKAETTRPPAPHCPRAAAAVRPLPSRIQRGAAARSVSATCPRSCIAVAATVAARCPPLEYPGPWKFAASAPTARSWQARRCLSRRRWPANMSPSKKSMTGYGRCTLARSRWPVRRTSAPLHPIARDHGGALRQLRWLRA